MYIQRSKNYSNSLLVLDIYKYHFNISQLVQDTNESRVTTSVKKVKVSQCKSITFMKFLKVGWREPHYQSFFSTILFVSINRKLQIVSASKNESKNIP